jgi:hypothetical protein
MKNFYPCSFCVLCFIIGNSSAFSQTSGFFKGMKSDVEAGAIISATPTNPFWIQSNQYGEVPLESQLFTLRGQIRKDYDSTKRFSYGYAGRAVMNVGKENDFLLSELYAKIRYKAIELYAGRRREIIGLVDSTLTSGSYIWSGNALPIPKIEVGIPNYTPIFFKNKILSVKGQYSHGWFGSGDSTENYFLHQSSLYFRLGKPSWRFKLYGGLNHQAQWGGRPRVPFYDAVTNTTVTRYGSSVEAYLNIALGLPIDFTTQKFLTGGQVYGEVYRPGNHLGSLDIALEYESTASRWLFYRQSIYDDGSIFFLGNITDGLTGVSWASRSPTLFLKRIVVEFLQTSNQGGAYWGRGWPEVVQGQDNYFNNGVYEEGWVYRRRTIGTAFLMPLRNATGLVPNDRLSAINPDYILNNRVKALTVGVISQLYKFDLLSRLTVSQNLGNYDINYPLSVRQLSLQQRISYPMGQYTVSANLAYDSAGLLQRNLGLMLLLKYSF